MESPLVVKILFLTLSLALSSCGEDKVKSSGLTSGVDDNAPKVVLTDLQDFITGYRYVWAIDKAKLANLPTWELTKSECPLSPHKAAMIAQELIRKSFPEPTKLTVHSVWLSKQGAGPDRDLSELRALWAYQISFTATPEPKPKERALLMFLCFWTAA